MTRIVFVRHAESAPSSHLPERAWPLSDLGRRQASELAAMLAELGVEALASSPHQRAIETLQPYAGQAGLAIAVDEGLRERSLGGWIADPAEVEEAVRRMHADLSYRREGGESGHACLARFDDAVGRVVETNQGRCVAIGSHGGVLSHFLARADAGLPPDFWRRIRNPHIFIFDVTGKPRWEGERTLDGAPGVLAPGNA